MRHAGSLSSGLGTASRFVVAAALASCGGARLNDSIPEPTLGATSAAEQAIRPLARRWLLASPVERHALERDLGAVAERFRGDPLVRYVDVLRAWDALERGQRDRATALARPLLDGPNGTVRDLAALVLGATERRSGHAKEALARLMPLLHKMLDPPATALLDEELVRAAVAAKEWRLALRLMDGWMLESSPGEREAVVGSIVQLFASFPESSLIVELRLRVQRGISVSHEEGRLAEALAHHLAGLAVAQQDVRLARLLLEYAGPLLGGAGEEVARLAGDRTRGRVTARTVGVLLALGSPSLQRRSADVVTGMAFGLRIGDTDARLVARDDAGDPAHVERALMELAAEGAAIIVLGIDARHAAPALQFARTQGLPVVLLTSKAASAAASVGPPDTVAFRLGEPADRSVGALASALRAEGAKVVAGLGAPVVVTVAGATVSDAATGGIGMEIPCAPLPQVDALRHERVDALVALDGAHCDSGVLELARALHAPLAVGLGAMVNVRLPEGAWVASAGVFPVAEERPTSDARLVGWFESGRPTPTWWMALGRDAAVLAVLAVHDLAASASDADVRARRIEAAAALAVARADLWTTEARGFDAARALPREIRIVRHDRTKPKP